MRTPDQYLRHKSLTFNNIKKCILKYLGNIKKKSAMVLIFVVAEKKVFFIITS